MALDPADRDLLADIRRALANPLRDPVRIHGAGGGVLVPRKLARAIERPLARMALAADRSAAC